MQLTYIVKDPELMVLFDPFTISDPIFPCSPISYTLFWLNDEVEEILPSIILFN